MAAACRASPSRALIDALAPDDIVLGGGNAKKLKKLPKGCRLGNNAYAFAGGFRLFEKTPHHAVQQGVGRCSSE